MGSFFPMFDYQGKKNFLISIWTSGNIEVQFQWMQTRPPFDNEAKRLELLHRLNELPGVSLPSQAINRRPSIALSNLKDAVFLKEFLDIFDWVIQEIKSESIV